MRPATEPARFLPGFIAAEGCFTRARADPGHHAFSVGLGAVDAGSIEFLLAFLGVGFVSRSARRAAHYDDEITFQVRKLAHLVGVVVPFMDAHLPPSHKRTQYEAWRADLLDYWEHRARRRRPCSVEAGDRRRRRTGCAGATSTSASGSSG
ncbi:MAG TPA: hypothetical protein VFJ85_06745 [Acidimicrobiales bacterium]|nr:hypothetical protein [Acidimicrobiales bacterium]